MPRSLKFDHIFSRIFGMPTCGLSAINNGTTSGRIHSGPNLAFFLGMEVML